MVTLLLELLNPQPPGRLWWFGRTPRGKAQDVLNFSLRAVLLFGPLACH